MKEGEGQAEGRLSAVAQPLGAQPGVAGAGWRQSGSLSAAPSPAGAVGRTRPDQLSGDRLGPLGRHCPLQASASCCPLGPQCPVFKVRVESLSVPLGGE